MSGDEVKTMNWDAVIAVSEIIGVVAVIASLIYVGAQIRQNTDLARATIVHETSVSFSRIHELLADNAELSDIYVRGVAGEELSVVDARRFTSLIEITMAYLEDVDHQWKSGLYFDEDDDTDIVVFLAPTHREFFSSPVFREWWRQVAPDSTTPSLFVKISNILANWDAESK